MLASRVGTKQARATSLPPEIWCTILDYLPRSDKLQVCQVSSYLCALARRAIYHEVKLHSYDETSLATFALLARDFSVARHVEKLHIYTSEEAVNEPPWFDATIFVGMTRLRYLNLIRNPFYAIGDQEEINNIISKSLLALKKLQFTNPPSEGRRPARKRAKSDLDVYGPKLYIKGLEEIVWMDSGVYLTAPG
ncbi:hypothetical protein BDZ94DRAFT_355685 [Collybia nuda]|uniref:F-box domain-containing protein n=1 Tax=Collybia nuda TaxID=64659 RepID=A0A9P5XVT7_9AGAR|nr:hypothetical protein BDZ94DRAFT_355685 [Collybia nuda]